MYCCGGYILSISCTDWPKKWKASPWTRHCVEPSYKRSLCLSSSDRERESVWSFLSRSSIGLLTWCMSSVKRGFVALRQLLAFNTHPHNSICVCDFPFGKLWAFNLTSQASVYIGGGWVVIISLMIQWTTVAALWSPSFTHTCQSILARVKPIMVSSCNVLTPEHCTVCSICHNFIFSFSLRMFSFKPKQCRRRIAMPCFPSSVDTHRSLLPPARCWFFLGLWSAILAAE